MGRGVLIPLNTADADILLAKDVACRLRCSVRTAQKLMSSQEIPSFQFRPGGEWRTTRIKLEGYIYLMLEGTYPPLKPGLTVIIPADSPDIVGERTAKIRGKKRQS
jgi:hypothetical protein